MAPRLSRIVKKLEPSLTGAVTTQPSRAPRLDFNCAMPVWLKYCVTSHCLSMIVAEQTTEACLPHHGTRLATHCFLPRDQVIIETLMIALRIIMSQVLMDHV